MSSLPKSQAKSIWRMRAFNREKTTDINLLLNRIKSNLDRLCDELYVKWYEIKDIQLLLIDTNWNYYKTHTIFPKYTSDRTTIFLALKKLFFSIYDIWVLYRKTWVSSSQIQSIHQKQLSLFDKENTEHASNLHIERLLHDIEEKYWKGILKVGV